jgi:hypothetical protein
MQVMDRTLRHLGRLAGLASLAALAAAAPSAGAAPARNMTRAEAEQVLADATIDFSQGDRHFYEYYAIDGVARGGDGAGGLRTDGRWRVRVDGTACFIHDDPNQSGCVFVRVDGERIEFHRVDGVVEGPFRLERGNPHRL